MNYKKLYRVRVTLGLAVTFGWSAMGPVFSAHMNILGSHLLALLGVMGTIVRLSQQWLRRTFTIQQLFAIVTAMDWMYIAVMCWLIASHQMHSILLVDELLIGPYMAVMVAVRAKLNNYTFSKWTGSRRDKIESKVDNRFLMAGIAGTAFGGVETYVVNFYGALIVQLVIIAAVSLVMTRILWQEARA